MLEFNTFSVERTIALLIFALKTNSAWSTLFTWSKMDAVFFRQINSWKNLNFFLGQIRTSAMQVTTCFRISKCLWNRRSSINFHDGVIIAAALSCRIVLNCLQQQIHHHYNLLSLRAEVCRLPDCKSYQNRSCGLLVV